MEITERPRRSPFVRYFDKTPLGIVCPHFYVLAHANGCLYRCAYCYLQLTFRGAVAPVVFSNRDVLLNEVRRFLEMPEAAVLNAGELSDALSTDSRTALTRELVPLFARQDRHLLVLLTKSTQIDNLLGLNHNGRTVVSFSVNADPVAGLYEDGAPAPGDRIAAAARLKEAGYRVRFRVDPVIPVPTWELYYADLLAAIMERAKPERVTLGSLRYFPNVRSYARKLGRDDSVFAYATERTRADGRLRVPLATRLRIYRHLMDLIPADVGVGLCKETEECFRALGTTSTACNCTL